MQKNMNFHRTHQLVAAAIFRKIPNYLTRYNLTDYGQTITGKLAVHCMGIEFGWIQNITIDTNSGIAEVGHFGVHIPMLRLGIAQAMFQAFFKQLRVKYGCKSVVFIEFLPSSDRGLFLLKLGATPKGNPNSKGFDSFNLLL